MDKPQKQNRAYLSLRLEIWDRRGSNLGFYSVGSLYDSLDDAIQEAREWWVTLPKDYSYQISIADQEGNRLWSYVGLINKKT